ncbi:hypothetical protein D3C81_1844480 [compost metagenome]
MALAVLPRSEATLAAKCSTMNSTFWVTLVACSDIHLANARLAALPSTRLPSFAGSARLNAVL